MSGEKDPSIVIMPPKKITVLGAHSDTCRGLVQRAVMLTGQYFEPVTEGPWNTVTVRSAIFRYPNIDLFAPGSCGLAELMSHCTETQDMCILIVDGESLVPLHSLSWSRWTSSWTRLSSSIESARQNNFTGTSVLSSWPVLARQLQILLQTDSVGDSMYPTAGPMACPHIVLHYPDVSSELSDWERGQIAGRALPLLLSGLSMPSDDQDFKDRVRQERLHFIAGHDFRQCSEALFPEFVGDLHGTAMSDRVEGVVGQ